MRSRPISSVPPWSLPQFVPWLLALSSHLMECELYADRKVFLLMLFLVWCLAQQKLASQSTRLVGHYFQVLRVSSCHLFHCWPVGKICECKFAYLSFAVPRWESRLLSSVSQASPGLPKRSHRNHGKSVVCLGLAIDRKYGISLKVSEVGLTPFRNTCMACGYPVCF